MALSDGNPLEDKCFSTNVECTPGQFIRVTQHTNGTRVFIPGTITWVAGYRNEHGQITRKNLKEGRIEEIVLGNGSLFDFFPDHRRDENSYIIGIKFYEP